MRLTLITLKYYVFTDSERGKKSVNDFITFLSGEATDEPIFQLCTRYLFRNQVHN